MFFCGACTHDNEKDDQIIIRDPLNVQRSQIVDKNNKSKMMSIMMDQIVRYHLVIPSKFPQYLNECVKKKTLFTDRQFPPNDSSLNFTMNNRKIVWKRIPQIIREPKFVQGIVQAADIQQGNAGDCYFLASISSIAQIPQRISKIFCNEMQLRPEGIYRLQVTIQGQYKEIIIDDYIPVFEGSNRPVFCKPYRNQVWVMLLQKAWAKLKGSYGNISSGFPHQVFNTFLVSPCFYFEIHNNMVKQFLEKAFLWTKIRYATQKMMPICAGSRKAYTCEGIKPAHTYSILGAFQVPSRGQTVNILKIRNPWGQCEYQGKYSQHDEAFWQKVSPILKLTIFKRRDQNDGIFTIEFNQFLRNFECLDISHDIPQYNYVFQKVRAKSNKPVFFQVEIQKNTNPNFYITAQKDFNRNRYIKNRQVQYGYTKLLLAKKQRVQVQGKQSFIFQYVNSLLQTNFPDLSLQIESLPVGNYVIMAQTDFVEDQQGDLTLSMYSKSVMNISNIKCPDPLFLHKIFTDHAYGRVPSQNRTLLSSYSEDWTVSVFLLHQGGYGYIFVHLGPGSKQRVQISCNIKKIYESGFLILQRQDVQKQSGQLQIILSENQQAIILLGVDFTKNIRQITFPPKGIKVSRII